MAFDRWKEKSEEEKLNAEKCEVCKCGCRLNNKSENASSELRDEAKAGNGTLEMENEGTIEGNFTFHIKRAVQISHFTVSDPYSLHCDGGDRPLIDLRSPNDALEDDLVPWTSRENGLDTNKKLHR